MFCRYKNGIRWDEPDIGPFHCVCFITCRFSKSTSFPAECRHRRTDIRNGHSGSHELFPSPVLTGPSTQEGTHQFGVEWRKKPSLWLTVTGSALGRRLPDYNMCDCSQCSIWIECQPAFDIWFHNVAHDDSERILIILFLSLTYVSHICMALMGILAISKQYSGLRSYRISHILFYFNFLLSIGYRDKRKV